MQSPCAALLTCIRCPCINWCFYRGGIALAFADDAFANEGILTPADLFRLRVEDPDKNHSEVLWKASILDNPVFRSGKSYIAKTMSLKYADFV